MSSSLLKVTQKRRSKDATSPKVKFYDGPNFGWPSCLGKKKKKNENSFSTGCDEQYVEQSTEETIQYVKCQRWWHVHRPSFEGDLTFQCDICLLLGDVLRICHNLVFL
jgi:hypothetical protein